MSPTSPAKVTGKEAEIILPPPSGKNPIPSLAAALRVDNQEQLLSLLLENPDPAKLGTTTSFRQLLVFGSDSLRTLLMRQVLTDPHSRSFKNKKKNWDDYTVFPNLPRALNVAGTAILGSVAESSVDVVTYFLRPSNLQQTQLAANDIFAWKNHTTHHRLVYLPQAPAMIHKILSDLSLVGHGCTNKHVSVHSLQLDLFSLESDVLSMEFPDAAREMLVEGTPSAVISDTARSILKLQDVVGRIPRIQAYGPAAEEVLRKLMSLAVEEHLAKDEPETEEAPGDVAAMMILDRKIDMVTPMVTPLTYEGLLDDVLGIDCGFVGVDVDVINPDDEEKKKRSETGTNIVALAVNDSDPLYAEVRNQHVEKFGSFLQNQARVLQATHSNFTAHGKKQELNELQKFVKQIPLFTQNVRSLTNHIHLAEIIKATSEEATFRERWQMERTMLEGDKCFDQLDDLVASQYPLYRFFRLMCLQSLCMDGIQSSRYDSLRRDVVQTYGYEYLFVLTNLEKAGLLKRRDGIFGVMDKVSPFNKLREHLALINAEVDTVDPEDIAYVSSGYAPISVRLVQYSVGGWQGIREDIMRELPGRFLDVIQQHPPEDLETTKSQPVTTATTYGSLASPLVDGKKKPVLMIMYVGGVTYMELAALRFLSKNPKFPYHIICCTTKIINGTTLLESLS